MTKFATFLKRRKIGVTELSAATGHSRRQIANIAAGKSGTTIDTAKRLALACADITGKRVRIGDLFDLHTPEVNDRRVR